MENFWEKYGMLIFSFFFFFFMQITFVVSGLVFCMND